MIVMPMKYKDLLSKTPLLVSSGLADRVYSKLVDDSRLSRFLAAVRVFSEGYDDIESIVDKLKESFPFYLDKLDFSADVFRQMLESYPDVAEAYSYALIGDDVDAAMIRSKALKLALNTRSLEEIAIYESLYNKELKEAESEGNSHGDINISFNISETEPTK